jgi:hypothetical protein
MIDPGCDGCGQEKLTISSYSAALPVRMGHAGEPSLEAKKA